MAASAASLPKVAAMYTNKKMFLAKQYVDAVTIGKNRKKKGDGMNKAEKR